MDRRSVIASGLGSLAASAGLLAPAPGQEAGDAGFKDGKYVLPPLPYAPDALEPHLDAATMRIHHDIHHKAYVDGLNNALGKLSDARKSGDLGLTKHWSREVAFHGAGHFLHLLFWAGMAPRSGGEPKGGLQSQIERDFGSFPAFQSHFSAAAAQVEGSGWALLAWEPVARQLLIAQIEKHQNQSTSVAVPLLALDVWEHAYYLKHQNRRADYVKAWWNVVNWPAAEQRLRAAKRA